VGYWLSGGNEFSLEVVEDLGDGEGIGAGGGFGDLDAAAEVGDHFADVGVAEEGLDPEDSDAALAGFDWQHLMDAVGGVGKGVAGGQLDGLPAGPGVVQAELAPVVGFGWSEEDGHRDVLPDGRVATHHRIDMGSVGVAREIPGEHGRRVSAG
jgi:hypothetical protein